MYPRSFLCEEAEIKQRTPLKKELCEISEEAVWESRFTSFLLFIYLRKQNDWKIYLKITIHLRNIIIRDIVDYCAECTRIFRPKNSISETLEKWFLD